MFIKFEAHVSREPIFKFHIMLINMVQIFVQTIYNKEVSEFGKIIGIPFLSDLVLDFKESQFFVFLMEFTIEMHDKICSELAVVSHSSMRNRRQIL